MRFLSLIVLGSMSLSLVPGMLNAGTEEQTKQLRTRYPRYQLRPGDVLDVLFSPAAEFTQTVSVQPDGYVTLREIGDVYVQGKTIPQATETITQGYGKILQQPVISLVLKDFEKPHFTVGGQVTRPGKYEMRSDTTLSEAVAVAGGLTDKAKHTQVLLFRRSSEDWVEIKQMDLKALYKGEFREDIHLEPGDMLFVPQNRISKLKPFLPIWSLGTYLGVTPRY